MDKIKSMFSNLTGGGDKVNTADVTNTGSGFDLGALQARAEEFGISSEDIAVLGKLDFPLDKAGIISALRSVNVSEQLISLVERVPDQVYDSLAELQEKLPI